MNLPIYPEARTLLQEEQSQPFVQLVTGLLKYNVKVRVMFVPRWRDALDEALPIRQRLRTELLKPICLVAGGLAANRRLELGYRINAAPSILEYQAPTAYMALNDIYEVLTLRDKRVIWTRVP